MTRHHVLWTSPQPLWGRFLAGTGGQSFASPDQARPAILGFTTDEFMDQLIGMLGTEPRRLAETIARPETWRTPLGDSPDLVERVALPRLARTLAKWRQARLPAAAIAPTSPERTVTENNVTRTLPLKLYHPAHQRHYVVAANLVCRLPGFPDRAIDTGNAEQIGFVLRRLLPGTADAPEEFGFVKRGAESRWQRVATDTQAADPHGHLADSEEILPLFPITFRDDVEHPRRMLAGVVPVGRRDEYMGARAERTVAAGRESTGGGTGAVATGTTPVSARKEQLKLDVVEPWKNLIRSAHLALGRINATDNDGGGLDLADKQAVARAANEQAQGQSWLILLDFADYLSLHLPRVWNAVVDPARRENLDNDQERRLFDWLNNPVATGPGDGWQITTPAFAATLRDALQRVRASQSTRTALETIEVSYPTHRTGDPAWPSFLYLLAGVRQSGLLFNAAGIHGSLEAFTTVIPDPLDVDAQPGTPLAAESDARTLDKLVQLVVTAIDSTTPSAPAPPLPFAAGLRDALSATNGDPGWFVMRCVYVRGDCGPLHPPTLSAPTQRFQLAGFFDPDAPARPIRIALPMDTTPAGMRKFNKNTAFIMSDVLCGQVQRAKGLGLGDLIRSVLPFPLHKPLDVGDMAPCATNGASIGMICSLSIPIITICALLLLMIIVSLLDLIFRWLPWFAICFPVPQLKAKR